MIAFIPLTNDEILMLTEAMICLEEALTKKPALDENDTEDLEAVKSVGAKLRPHLFRIASAAKPTGEPREIPPEVRRMMQAQWN